MTLQSCLTGQTTAAGFSGKPLPGPLPTSLDRGHKRRIDTEGSHKRVAVPPGVAAIIYLVGLRRTPADQRSPRPLAAGAGCNWTPQCRHQCKEG